MKITPLLTGLTILVCSLVSAIAQTPPTRIMPLGDSITFGSSVPGGYRNKLYSLLTTAGYNVDFVGVQTGNAVASLPDSDHQGIGGWRIDQVDADISKWFGIVADPDVILLHIGTNDFGQGVDTVNAINRWDALITKLATKLPYAHIIVTNLMERGEPHNTNIQTLFNPFVQAKVDAQVALGRRVTFLDMRSAVPLAEMPDNLHPGQAGYDHMADAWSPAVQAVISPLGDSSPPGISRATGSIDRTHVNIIFSKPVMDGAADTANFSIPGLTISAATLDSAKRVVTLTTSQQTLGSQYTATVNNITDRTVAANVLPANSTISFFAATPRGYLNNVPESVGYSLAYSLDIPTTANYKTSVPAYTVNNSAQFGPISRVAYYLELQQGGGDLQYVWASMDPFTTDAKRIAVPTILSGGQFQTNVTNMTVISNSPNVTTGTGITGNIEFWPLNYQATNSANIPGASATLFDFGDTPSAGNYGSMQIHNFSAAQTILSFSNWGGNTNPGDVCLGMGNNPLPTNNGVDWTFANNGASYTIRTLQVLVKTDGDLTPPSLVTAQQNFPLNKIYLTLSEPILRSSLQASNFTISGGVVVLNAAMGSSAREIVLTTTAQPIGTALTLTVSGLRDTSCNANVIPANSSITISPPALPAEVTTNVGASSTGYQTVYSIDLPVTGNLNALGAAAYRIDDHLALGGFDRVAYYLELQTAAGTTQFAWAAMDAWTASRGKIGIPLLSTGAMFQQNITNLEVLSNVNGVVNGTTAAGGNIEIWPNSYTQANGLSVPNASATNYDTGDTVSGTIPTAGYGCLQIHNHDTGAAQTVLAVNRFGTDGQILDVGIGNSPAPVTNGVDWTFASNAGSFVKRTLHVMVRPSANFFTPANVVANVGSSVNGYQLAYSIDLPSSGTSANLLYSTNNAADILGVSRVAYYLELLPTGSSTPNWIWTAMDAFTPDAKKVGIPTVAAGATFQQNVTNLEVKSNVAGIVQGTTVSGGNIEFWPNSYSAANAIGIPNASASAYDFGDTMTGATIAAGYGSMQVHNHDAGAKQTLFAFNHWGTTSGTATTFCLGIGNSPNVTNLDWTFADNAATAYATTAGSRRMHIFVLPTNGDLTGPVISRVTNSSALNRCVTVFNEPISDVSALPANFSISDGIQVLTATLVSPNEVALTTSPQTPGTTYTVTVSNIRDRSSLGNISLPGASGTFTAYTHPPVLASIPESSNFNMLYALAMPNTALYDRNAVPYSLDESKFPQTAPLDRVAYLMELTAGVTSSWVWVSFDPITTAIGKLGVPTISSGAVFQQALSNMSVLSSVGAPVVNGTGFTGNIEFWPTNYSAPNALGVLNASATNFDWGDTRSTTGNHGSMQIHNPGQSQTIFAYNAWGGTGTASSIGIGNDPAPVTLGVDWTFHNNAATYSTKNLYVFGRSGGTAIGTSPLVLTHPCPRTVTVGQLATFSVAMSGNGPFTYQWRFNGSPLQNQTSQWLDIVNPSLLQDGDYDCVIFGEGAVQATTNVAHLTVLPDTVPPVLGATPNVNVFTTDPTGMVVAFAIPTASDNSTQPPVITFTPASGTKFPLGTTPVTCSATDASGNATSQQFTVTVGFNSVHDTQIAFLPNGHISVVFRGTTGQTYTIQRTGDLNQAWTTIATVTAGADGTIPVDDPSPLPNRGFYRIAP